MMVSFNDQSKRVVIIHRRRRKVYDLRRMTDSSLMRLCRVIVDWQTDTIGRTLLFETPRKPVVQPEPEEERLMQLDVDVYVPEHDYRRWRRFTGCLD